MELTLLISKPTWEVGIIPWFWGNWNQVIRSQGRWHNSKSTARDTDRERDTHRTQTKKLCSEHHWGTPFHTTQGFSKAWKEIERKHKGKLKLVFIVLLSFYSTCTLCNRIFLKHVGHYSYPTLDLVPIQIFSYFFILQESWFILTSSLMELEVKPSAKEHQEGTHLQPNRAGFVKLLLQGRMDKRSHGASH